MEYYTATKMNKQLLLATIISESHKHNVGQKKPAHTNTILSFHFYKLLRGVRVQNSDYSWAEESSDGKRAGALGCNIS